VRVLVTGGEGFAARHARRAFAARGWETVSADVAGSPDIRMDLQDAGSVRAAVEAAHADAILHLGGIAFVPTAWEKPAFVFDVNASGTMRILEAVRTTAPATRVLCVTSAEIYGNAAAGGAPVKEDAPLVPDNLYGATKAAADMAALAYAKHFALAIMTARPGNHIGPGQNPSFVTSAFASRVKAIAEGRETHLAVGNLEQPRDFTDARDVVEAYADILERGEPGTAYNIAHGERVTTGEILRILQEIAGTHAVPERDERYWRPTDHHVILDTTRIRALGWAPRIPIRQSLEDLYASL
jgi:GDP-4-dehydro-6-deoxy-D-mannose reductase